eukprot:scaffold6905_cov62-Phaeocystis_antarctica.AAC.5
MGSAGATGADHLPAGVPPLLQPRTIRLNYLPPSLFALFPPARVYMRWRDSIKSSRCKFKLSLLRTFVTVTW